MKRRPVRPQISVRAETYAVIAAVAKAKGQRIGATLEQAVLAYLDGKERAE